MRTTLHIVNGIGIGINLVTERIIVNKRYFQLYDTFSRFCWCFSGKRNWFVDDAVFILIEVEYLFANTVFKQEFIAAVVVVVFENNFYTWIKKS